MSADMHATTRLQRARVIAVAGMMFGDEGKGASVEALARRLGARWVVRANGGPQAAHHLVQQDGRVHCCAQLTAGVMTPGVQSFLSSHMLIEPLSLMREVEAATAAGARDVLERLVIDPSCVVVTPFHKHLNRLTELLRDDARHGSCGLGVGRAALDAARPDRPTLRVRDVQAATTPAPLIARLEAIRAAALAEARARLSDPPRDDAERLQLDRLEDPTLSAHLAHRYHAILCGTPLRIADARALHPEVRDAPGPLLFEGAQGVLLDAALGFWPHVTPSRTTFANPEAIAATLRPGDAVFRLGVTRAYTTRHGAGPLPGEDEALRALLPEPHNARNDWQGAWRVAPLDLVALRHAIACVGGVDGLAITHLDALDRGALTSATTAYLLPPSLHEAHAPLWWPRAAPHPAGDARPVTHLHVRHNATPDERAARTRALLHARPRHEPLPRTRAAFLAWLQRVLPHAPVALLSDGMTSDHRTLCTQDAAPRISSPGALNTS